MVDGYEAFSSTRRCLLAGIGTASLAGCLSLPTTGDRVEHRVTFRNRLDEERTVEARVKNFDDDVVFSDTVTLSSDTLSEGHRFEGDPSRVVASSNELEAESTVSQSTCDDRAPIHIGVTITRDREIVIDDHCGFR